MVQEALVAKISAAKNDYAVTLCDLASEDVEAGTAVLVRRFDATAATRLVVSPQTYAVPVEVTTPTGTVIVVAAHVYPGKNQHADLTRFVELVSTTYGDKPVLVGGDFNSARRFDEVYGGKSTSTPSKPSASRAASPSTRRAPTSGSTYCRFGSGSALTSTATPCGAWLPSTSSLVLSAGTGASAPSGMPTM